MGGGGTLPITNVFKVFTFDDENIATTYDKSLRKLAITRQHFNLWTTGTHTLGTPVYRNVFMSYLGIKFSERRYKYLFAKNTPHCIFNSVCAFSIIIMIYLWVGIFYDVL